MVSGKQLKVTINKVMVNGSSIIVSAYLKCVDKKKNHNKFYDMTITKAPKANDWDLNMHYGRIGTDGRKDCITFHSIKSVGRKKEP